MPALSGLGLSQTQARRQTCHMDTDRYLTSICSAPRIRVWVIQNPHGAPEVGSAEVGSAGPRPEAGPGAAPSSSFGAGTESGYLRGIRGPTAGSWARLMIPDPATCSPDERHVVLRAPLPALATSGGHHRKGRHQAKVSPRGLPGQRQTKSQRVGSHGQSDPDSPARLAAAASQTACLRPLHPPATVLSHSQHFPPLPIDRDKPQAHRVQSIYSQTLPGATSHSGYCPATQPPHQTKRSPASRSLHMHFPRRERCSPNSSLAWPLLLLRVSPSGSHSLERPSPTSPPHAQEVRLSPDTLFLPLGPSARCVIISFLPVHLTHL